MLNYVGDAAIYLSPEPRNIKARQAVRDAGGVSETYAIGWLPGAAPGTLAEFPVRVADSSGRLLREFKITPPRPRGNFLIYPSGMAWDRAADSFWYLERNSATVVNVSPAGVELSRFPHPAPIHQDDIRNYGLAIDSERGALYLSGAGRLDFQVTKLVEVTRSGRETGVDDGSGGRSLAAMWTQLKSAHSHPKAVFCSTRRPR